MRHRCGHDVWQIRHRFRDDAMADDLDMSGLRLAGMPDVHSPTISNVDQSNVRTNESILIRLRCRKEADHLTVTR